MGNTTTLPATDNGGNQLTATYYANNRIDTLAQSGVTDTYTLDPTWRIRTIAYSNNSDGAQTYHYATDGDSPNWIATNTTNTTWTRNIQGIDGSLCAEQQNTGSITYQLTDLHGNAVATTTSTGTLTATYDYLEFGTPAASGPTPYGWLGGYQRSVDTTSGVLLMGQRGYAGSIGRFLQVDTVPGSSANAYDYVNQDPIVGLDVSGTMPIGCTRGACAYVHGTASSVYVLCGRHGGVRGEPVWIGCSVNVGHHLPTVIKDCVVYGASAGGSTAGGGAVVGLLGGPFDWGVYGTAIAGATAGGCVAGTLHALWSGFP